MGCTDTERLSQHECEQLSRVYDALRNMEEAFGEEGRRLLWDVLTQPVRLHYIYGNWKYVAAK